MRKACKARHVTLEEVLEGGRTRVMTRAREDCIMIMLDAGLSLMHAADLLNLDHTSVISARDRVRKRVA
jgi:chromosomal replication initiation ATPase DnaA